MHKVGEVGAMPAEPEIFVRPRIRRLVTIAFLVGMILGALAVFAVRFGLALGQDEQLAVVASPNGKYEVVVYADPGGVIDPVWRVTIRERNAFRPTEWTVGCISGDDPLDAFTSVRWGDWETLVVVTEESSARVTVEPRTGKPSQSSSLIWNWDC